MYWAAFVGHRQMEHQARHPALTDGDPQTLGVTAELGAQIGWRPHDLTLVEVEDLGVRRLIAARERGIEVSVAVGQADDHYAAVFHAEILIGLNEVLERKFGSREHFVDIEVSFGGSLDDVVVDLGGDLERHRHGERWHNDGCENGVCFIVLPPRC